MLDLLLDKDPATREKVETPPRTDKYHFVIPEKFKHHNYTEMEKYLIVLSNMFPNITRLYSIGRSVEGRQLHVLEISDNPGKHEPGKVLHDT